MVVKAVIGANYGDEGKGLMTDYFCHQALKANKNAKCLNVLTNGGSQRGHTVRFLNYTHIFHHFGSGTFANADTYIPATFVSNPLIFVDEYKLLNKNTRFTPKPWINNNCLVSTPFDMIYNILFMTEQGLNNSCGYGIYETKRRNGARFIRYACMTDNEIEKDLLDIRDVYYKQKIEKNNIHLSENWKNAYYSDNLIHNFIHDFRSMQHICTPVCDQDYLFDQYDTIIFENGQGLLLDKDYDPEYGTSSNTGLKAVFDVIGNRNDLDIEACYVSRTYLTRHGDGKFDEEIDFGFIDKTNVYNPFQGDLRYANINYEALYERIKKDSSPYKVKTTIALTHADEIKPDENFSYNYISNGPTRDHICSHNLSPFT